MDPVLKFSREMNCEMQKQEVTFRHSRQIGATSFSTPQLLHFFCLDVLDKDSVNMYRMKGFRLLG